MKVSAQYKETLRKKFRFNKAVWEDSLGEFYIGYNHKVKPHERYPKNITRKEATKIYDKDIFVIERFLNRNLKREIDQKHFNIMVSVCYDIGTKAFKNSLFFNLYRVGTIEEAFNHFMNFTHFKGELVSSLYKRRKEELIYLQQADTGLL